MIETRAEAFLSYAELDRQRATQINDWLMAQGVRTHFYHRNVEIGAQIEFEERQLRSAITVVAMLGEHGWGPNHMKQVASALELKVPVLPVLIGEPPQEAFGMLDGLFQKLRYLDLREDDPSNLRELLRTIWRHAPGSDGRVDYFVRILIDRDDEDRYR